LLFAPFDLAHKAYAQTPGRQIKPQAEKLFWQAIEQFQKANYRQALELFKLSLATSNREKVSDLALVYSCHCLINLEGYDAAEDILRNLSRKRPNRDPLIKSLRVKLIERRQKLKAALTSRTGFKGRRKFR